MKKIYQCEHCSKYFDNINECQRHERTCLFTAGTWMKHKFRDIYLFILSVDAETGNVEFVRVAETQYDFEKVSYGIYQSHVIEQIYEPYTEDRHKAISQTNLDLADVIIRFFGERA